MNSFESKITKDSITIETVVDHTYIEHGINLSGTIYIEGVETDDVLETIRLVVCKKNTKEILTKQSFELVGTVASKGTQMIPFEIIPDERWLPAEGEEETHLTLQTVALFFDGSSEEDAGELIFDIEE